MPNTSPHIDPRRLLLKLYESAVDAVSAERCLPSYLPRKAPRGRTVVIGAGKGAAAMAKVVEDHWPHPLTGLVITPYGHGVDCGLIEVVEAGHPVPDDAGRRRTERVLELRSEEHTSELQSLMRISYAVFCLKNKKH